MQALLIFLGLPAAILSCEPPERGAPRDQVSLLQEHVRVQQQPIDWQEFISNAQEEAGNITGSVQDLVDRAANSTTRVIDIIIESVHTSLDDVHRQARILNAKTEKPIFDLTAMVTKIPTLHTFIYAGNATLDAFLKWYVPVVTSLNHTERGIKTILAAAGFTHLAHEVDSILSEAVEAANETLRLVLDAQRILNDLSLIKEDTKGKLTEEVDWDFEVVEEYLSDAVDQMNITMTDGMITAIYTLVSKLRATLPSDVTMNSMLNENQVNRSLQGLLPRVPPILKIVKEPLANISAGFTSVIAALRPKLAWTPNSGAIAGGRACFLAIAASVWLAPLGSDH